MQQQQHAVQTKNFYRRKLPSSCINFTSAEGKKLFIESLIEGMNFVTYAIVGRKFEFIFKVREISKQ